MNVWLECTWQAGWWSPPLLWAWPVGYLGTTLTLLPLWLSGRVHCRRACSCGVQLLAIGRHSSFAPEPPARIQYSGCSLCYTKFVNLPNLNKLWEDKLVFGEFWIVTANSIFIINETLDCRRQLFLPGHNKQCPPTSGLITMTIACNSYWSSPYICIIPSIYLKRSVDLNKNLQLKFPHVLFMIVLLVTGKKPSKLSFLKDGPKNCLNWTFH